MTLRAPVHGERGDRGDRGDQGGWRRRTEAGFSLIEVLVSLSIFALAAVAILAAQNQGTRTSAHLEDRLLAEIVCENQLVETLVTQGRPASGERTGEARLAGKLFLWRRTVRPTGVDSVLLVEVAVRRNGQEQEIISLTGFHKGG